MWIALLTFHFIPFANIVDHIANDKLEWEEGKMEWNKVNEKKKRSGAQHFQSWRLASRKLIIFDIIYLIAW